MWALCWASSWQRLLSLVVHCNHFWTQQNPKALPAFEAEPPEALRGVQVLV